MAIILLGATIEGIRGSIGGVTYSANAAGPYARAWTRPTNPRSPGQTVARQTFQRSPANWYNLTAGERSDWAALAALDPEPHYNSLGEPYVLSGPGLFTMCNTRRAFLDLDPLTAAPAGLEATQPGAFTISALWVSSDPLDLSNITWDDLTAEDDCYAVLLIYVVPAPTAYLAPATLHWTAAVDSHDDQIIFNEELFATFGTVQAGWTCIAHLYQQRASGLRSTLAAISTTIL